MPVSKRRFAINPGPLKVVPASQREHMSEWEASQAARCVAELKNGSGRCLNNGRVKINGRWLCGVHAPSAAPSDDDAPRSAARIAPMDAAGDSRKERR